ncbi:uncharacterized protein LOC122722072 [Manihot esculenta]|uniref:uncharacterized protein LOC122722072 n=1 Tax=Manihot esculenta TaxID=3983 RepID=UPI001CC431C6|nr:uncharacterized protein LOC122722072 [Manihot esculenta]
MQVIRPPFPERFAQSKREKEKKEILKIFRKVQVNIPLLETIKKIPKYAKFLKDLWTNKRKLYGHEKIKVGENVSVVLQRKFPQKYKDKGMFVISRKFGNLEIKKAMCDLGASINIMPLSVYLSLDAADFFVLVMEEDSSSNSTDLLLGRPFLSTARMKIDMQEGTLTMEFDGEEVKFNVYDVMKYSDDNFSLCSIDIINPLAQETFKLSKEDKLEVVLTENLTMDCLDNSTLQFNEEIIETVYSLDTLSHKAPKLKLKTLPTHLKYAFLGSNNTLPIIITSKLNPLKAMKFIWLLNEYKDGSG